MKKFVPLVIISLGKFFIISSTISYRNFLFLATSPQDLFYSYFPIFIVYLLTRIGSKRRSFLFPNKSCSHSVHSLNLTPTVWFQWRSYNLNGYNYLYDNDDLLIMISILYVRIHKFSFLSPTYIKREFTNYVFGYLSQISISRLLSFYPVEIVLSSDSFSIYSERRDKINK